jgi:hypothetical protein
VSGYSGATRDDGGPPPPIAPILCVCQRGAEMSGTTFKCESCVNSAKEGE